MVPVTINAAVTVRVATRLRTNITSVVGRVPAASFISVSPRQNISVAATMKPMPRLALLPPGPNGDGVVGPMLVADAGAGGAAMVSLMIASP
jgi:hypothetical protein